MARQDTLYILTANDLLEGDVIFLGHAGWLRDHRGARIARDDDEAKALEAIGAADKAAMKIVDPYLVEVALTGDGTPVPIRYRERLRTRGPSVRPDLGKQALLRANSSL
jgi:sulfite reductase (NADPH) hemoprotein beta-component